MLQVSEVFFYTLENQHSVKIKVFVTLQLILASYGSSPYDQYLTFNDVNGSTKNTGHRSYI